MCPMGGTSLFGWFELTGCHFDKEAAKLSGLDQAKAFRDKVLPLMEELRSYVDSAEVLTADEYWPVSTYGELLFKV